MGTDKALLPGPDGRPMAVVAADALAGAGAARIAVVGGDGARLLELGLEPLPDLHPGEGPLGGIVTALTALGPDADLVVVLACDMPEVGPEVPGALVAALDAAPTAGVAVALVGEREQPLTACWRSSVARPVLEEAFAAGERAPRHLLGRLGVVRVGGLPVGQLLDVDSPEDLRRYAGPPLHRPLDEQDPA